MTQSFPNPFGNLRIEYPADQSPHYQTYCSTAAGMRNVDQTPFRRMIDMWFTAMSLAARRGLRPLPLGRNPSHMTNGSIFDGVDSWRIHAIMLVAIEIENNEKVVTNSNRMIEIANGLAAAGIPHIVEMLQEGGQAPIWNLSDALTEELTPT